MNLSRWQRLLLTVLAGAGLVIALWSTNPRPHGESLAEPEVVVPLRAFEQPLPMPAHPVSLELTIGAKDKEQVPWEGEISVSEGRVVEVQLIRGAVNSKIDGSKFFVRARRQPNKKPGLLPAVLRVNLDAPASAKVTIKLKQEDLVFSLADLKPDTTRNFLNDQVLVEKQETGVRITGRGTEDDHPVLAKGTDGSVWLAYVEYTPGKPIVMERVTRGEFDTCIAEGHGDRVRLRRFDGKTWLPPLDVTDGGLDVWRPTVAVDGKGNIWVVWSQNLGGDWEIMARRYDPAGNRWSEPARLTNHQGSDFGVVSATDPAGVVWLAWQSWRGDNFDIMVQTLADGHPWRQGAPLAATKANDWRPDIAISKKGTVYIGYDTYDPSKGGGYRVEIAELSPQSRPDQGRTLLLNAATPRFQARPSLAVDGQDRLWFAYEEGDEQWGKDYSTEQFKRIGFDRNPGFALYVNRTIRVKCYEPGGGVKEPAAGLQAAFADRLGRNKSVPRLAPDQDGGLWLLFRHSPNATGAGEVWCSYATRFDGRSWSPAQRLPSSENLLDNKPALAATPLGVLAAYSGDARQNTRNRDQDDIFVAVLPGGPAQTAELVPQKPEAAASLPVVHPNEAQDVARMRGYRVEAGGKQYRLLRGEFHRHTEYSAHRDQDGLLEDSWRYALDVAQLDWMGNGDHDNGYNSEYMWWQIQKICDLYQNPPRFIAAMTYERSVVYPNGHRNVIMPRRGIRPLPRGDMTGSAEKGTADTKMLYAYLKHFGSICSSHTSGTNMGTDWRDNDPEVEPVVEIYQGHRHNYEHSGAPRAATADTQIGGYEPAGYVWNALEKGYRLGFQCSSDHVSTHMSYAVVLTEDVSRQGIIDAFKKRHSYAATDNIVVDVRSGDRLMGDIFDSAQRPTLDIRVLGTAPIAKVHVIRDNKYVYTAEPKSAEVKLRYADMDQEAGKTSYYYVRVEQADGNLAWASPMWITYKP